MSGERIISGAVIAKQQEASDPDVHAWVSANAGSGKTYVLAQRVIRLLLEGVDPARILCVTFTKAAAGNMANKVFDRLRGWTALDDKALAEAMKGVGARDTGPNMLARARRLFAQALETPGGLKVQTIHAFCTHVLHLFPFEANVAARFSVLDEAEEAQLLEHMTNDVLLDAAASPQSDGGRALQYAIGTAADITFRELITEAVRERDRVEAWVESAGGLDGAKQQLSTALGLDPEDDEETIAAEFLGNSKIARSEWAQIAAIAASGSSTDHGQAERFIALPTLAGARQIDHYIEIFCTKEGKKRKNIFTAAIKNKHGSLCERLEDERERVGILIERRRAVAARDRTIALLTIAKAVLDRFSAEKRRRGLLDFDDQIDKTRDLLARESAAWVHYKLDRGIDHVLIDEAQDTSPKQWDIIRHLVAEFFAGQGATDRKRTIFAVGDDKQSIFSFQGAKPVHFESMRREFDALSGRSKQTFRLVTLDTSLRSGINVLAAVDLVFAPNDLARSLTKDAAGIPEHIALESAAPGEVDIWDTEKPVENTTENDAWSAPFDTLTGSEPPVRLAARIAKAAQQLIASGRHAGDMLVLVNRRGVLFEAIIRALKQAAVPVAGADRLVLTDHIAVMDLMVLGDALLLPQDDLALATALKSPLFGFDDDDIFALAHGRGEASLRSQLSQQAAGNPKFAAALARLDDLAARSRDMSPFAFYARLLGAGAGRARFLARLGHEAADALDEFLNLALDYERAETPSLQGFLDWLRAAKAQIKRDMETGRDEVRVMTVHGAKGLEAPIVFLAETTMKPEGHHPAPLMSLPPITTAPPLVWAKGKGADIGPMNDARERAIAETRDEDRRLLYVAMTRAAEKLIVCGTDNKVKRPEGCWYDLMMQAMNGAPGFTEHDEDERKVWRYRKIAPAAKPAPKSKPVEPEPKIPDWLKLPLAPEKRIHALTPSTAIDDIGQAHKTPAAKTARERGTLMHRLLQSLPGIAPERRAKAARSFLGRAKGDFDKTERETMAAQALRLLDDERFAALFAPGSRAEVSIAGMIERDGETISVSGQIDRLAVTENEVLIGDFKTNRPVPSRIGDVPPAYLTQLALYRALLQKIYPQKNIRAALIWTETTDLMELSEGALDAAFASQLRVTLP